MNGSCRALLMLVAVALILGGCATTMGKKAGVSKISDDHWVAPVEEHEEETTFLKESLDINSDQKPDVFNYYRNGEGETHLACLNTRFRDACREHPREFMSRQATADL